MIPILIVAGVLVVWNIITFSLYAADKRKAKNNEWRIKEATLFMVAFLMGGIGSMLGMSLLRHKTKHMSFRILIPLAVVLNIAVIVGVVLLLNHLDVIDLF